MSIASSVPSTKPLDGIQDSQSQNVRVVVRCRPLSTAEKRDPKQFMCVCVEPNNSIVVSMPNVPRQNQQHQEKRYSFETCFNPYTTQDEVFHRCGAAVVDEVLSGFKCTIFAYGQTGTGKTFTMEGDMAGESLNDNAGIIPRSISRCFDRLEARSAEYSVRVSFLEIYNEELCDMLSDSKRPLKLFESSKGISVGDLTEVKVTSKPEIYSILQKAVQSRRVAETKMNKASSRSHCIFTLSLSIKEQNEDGGVCFKVGKLNLVDLAGSESIGRSGAKKQHAREAGNINQSLLTLGRVITALVEHHGHVPYRDSKLTRLLQDSLGGRTKTCIITTISPSSLCVEETISTLDYALKAKSIQNKPELNTRVSPGTLLREVNGDIEKIKNEIAMAKDKTGIYMTLDDYEMKMAKLQGLMNDVQQLEQELHSKKESHEELRIQSADTNAQLEREEKVTHEVTAALEKCTRKFAETKTALEAMMRHIKLARYSNMEAAGHVQAIGTQAVKCSEELSASLTQMDMLHTRIEKEDKLFQENLEKTVTTEGDHSTLAQQRQQSAEALANQFSEQILSLRSTIQQTWDESKLADSQFQEGLNASAKREDDFANDRISALQEITRSTFESLDVLSAGAKSTGEQWLKADLMGTVSKARSGANGILAEVLQNTDSSTQAVWEGLEQQTKQINSCKKGFADIHQTISSELQAVHDRFTTTLTTHSTKLTDAKTRLASNQARCHQSVAATMAEKTKQLEQAYNALLEQQRAGWEDKINELKELDLEQGELFREIATQWKEQGEAHQQVWLDALRGDQKEFTDYATQVRQMLEVKQDGSKGQFMEEFEALNKQLSNLVEQAGASNEALVEDLLQEGRDQRLGLEQSLETFVTQASSVHTKQTELLTERAPANEPVAGLEDALDTCDSHVRYWHEEEKGKWQESISKISVQASEARKPIDKTGATPTRWTATATSSGTPLPSPAQSKHFSRLANIGTLRRSALQAIHEEPVESDTYSQSQASVETAFRFPSVVRKPNMFDVEGDVVLTQPSDSQSSIPPPSQSLPPSNSATQDSIPPAPSQTEDITPQSPPNTKASEDVEFESPLARLDQPADGDVELQSPVASLDPKPSASEDMEFDSPLACLDSVLTPKSLGPTGVSFDTDSDIEERNICIDKDFVMREDTENHMTDQVMNTPGKRRESARPVFRQMENDAA